MCAGWYRPSVHEELYPIGWKQTGTTLLKSKAAFAAALAQRAKRGGSRPLGLTKLADSASNSHFECG